MQLMLNELIPQLTALTGWLYHWMNSVLLRLLTVLTSLIIVDIDDIDHIDIYSNYLNNFNRSTNIENIEKMSQQSRKSRIRACKIETCEFAKGTYEKIRMFR